jgi:hypothetical protein
MLLLRWLIYVMLCNESTNSKMGDRWARRLKKKLMLSAAQLRERRLAALRGSSPAVSSAAAPVSLKASTFKKFLRVLIDLVLLC